ncbi:hypothetical protein [Runella sp. SP2]|uniref:hypothetical protein n=1 Tax=Runella sp. SP2 TaxID=2268026 RepID=UPI000F092E92|nr:hypothetical protein [Runella sp. SP2]AYQ32956.1 hypothetical protein DTQ70_12690 [Runella sp. SP2]
MSNTERFDEWVRGELDSLDSPPENFRSGMVWQQLQAELHPVAKEKPLFVRQKKDIRYRIAAAVGLLLLVGGVGWRMQWFVGKRTDNQVANQRVEVLSNQPLITVTKEKTSPKVTPERLIVRKKLAVASSPAPHFAPAPTLSETEPNHEATLPAIEPEPLVVAKAEAVPTTPEVAAASMPEASQTAAVKPSRFSITKNKTKPSFKIVHANELVDYQKVEMAEAREKEAKAKGFVVINWQTNSSNQSASSIMTYLRRKD